MLLSVSQLLQGVLVKPLLMPNPSPRLPNLFWGAKIHSWGSQLRFGVPNPSLLHRMRLFSGGTCGGMGMVTGTPSTPAAPSWPGTSGVRDATRAQPGVTRGRRHSSTDGEARGAGSAQISCTIGEKFPVSSTGSEKGAEGGEQTGVRVLVPSSGQ